VLVCYYFLAQVCASHANRWPQIRVHCKIASASGGCTRHTGPSPPFGSLLPPSCTQLAPKWPPTAQGQMAGQIGPSFPLLRALLGALLRAFLQAAGDRKRPQEADE